MSAQYPKMPPDKDGRRKLTDEDKIDIVAMRNSIDKPSYNTIAKKFGVSKRLIIFICNPESKRAEYQRRRERIARGEYRQYNAEKGAEYMRRYRQKLRDLGLMDQYNECERQRRRRK